MRPMSDYAPPDAPIRSRIPIDLPDEMEIHQHESRVILWLALALFVIGLIGATAAIVVMS